MEEDLVEDDNDDDDDDASPDEHARARIDPNRIVASNVGTLASRRRASAGKTAVRLVVESISLIFPRVMRRPFPSFDLVGGLPLLPSGEPDLLSRLALYPGEMSNHIEGMKASSLRGNVRLIAITKH